MNIKDLKACLPYLFKAEVTGFIWGHAGVGKSTVIKQYAKEVGYKFFPLYLGTQSDLGDVLGLQEFVRDENGKALSTAFASPEWIVDIINYCNENPESGAIIFLDEFNRARRDIISGMFSLALDKTFHTLKLPKNCHVIAAGNPPTDEYNVTDVDDSALMARFAHIKLEPSFNEWVEFAKGNEFDTTIISFLQEQPQLLEDSRTDFNLPVKIDRRCWSRVQGLKNVNTPPHLLEQLMGGIIGTERLVAYKAHLQVSDKPLTGEEVLSGRGLDKVSKWSNPKDIKSSLLANTSDNVTQTIVGKGISEGQDIHLVAFLLELPKELCYSLMKKLIETDNADYKKFLRDERFSSVLVPILKEAKGLVDATNAKKSKAK